MSDGKPLVRLETLQLLYASLTIGLLVFVAVVPLLVGRAWDPLRTLETDRIWLMVTSIFALAVVGSVGAVGRAMLRRARRELRGRAAPEVDDLLRLYLPYVLARGALIEGLGFFGTAVYMASGLRLGLVVGLVALGGLLVTFPTRDRFGSFRDRLTGGPL